MAENNQVSVDMDVSSYPLLAGGSFAFYNPFGSLISQISFDDSLSIYSSNIFNLSNSIPYQPTPTNLVTDNGFIGGGVMYILNLGAQTNQVDSSAIPQTSAHLDDSFLTTSTVNFSLCTFTKNDLFASIPPVGESYSGGSCVYILSSDLSSKTQNSLSLVDCLFRQNSVQLLVSSLSFAWHGGTIYST